MSSEPRGAMHMLPRSAYPLKMEAFGPTGECVWTETITLEMAEQLVSVRVPPLREQAGGPVSMKITYSDGQVHWTYPDETDG